MESVLLRNLIRDATAKHVHYYSGEPVMSDAETALEEARESLQNPRHGRWM
jgi:hypothetical protein